MSRPLVVSSAGPGGMGDYGWKFLAGFSEFWPPSVDLAFYVEANEQHPRASMRQLFAAAPACGAFLERWAGFPATNGREPRDCWSRNDRAHAYSFRTDAVKFCRKVFVMAHAARQAVAEGREIMAWIDADVRTFAEVPEGFLADLLGDADVAYLGRVGIHSECGFMVFRLPAALGLLEAMERIYATDAVFLMREWHDSYVFDRVRETADLRQRDLADGKGRHHVWIDTPLADYMDHLKGARKFLGFSPERMKARR